MQQINLYLPEFRPNRDPLRAIHMLWGSAVFLCLLVMFSVYSNHRYHQLEQQLQQEQQAQLLLKQRLDQLNAQKPTQTAGVLDAEIERLQKSLRRHQQILAMITHQDLGNEKGFSAQLDALSAAALPTIAVEFFSLQHGGSYAELSGKTRRADQVPLYLQRLRANPAFATVGFGVLSVGRDQQMDGVLEFSLSKPGKEKSAGEKQ